jgi:hypothetical protein
MSIIKPVQHKNTTLDKNKNSMAEKNNINILVGDILFRFIKLKDNKIVSSLSQTQQ